MADPRNFLSLNDALISQQNRLVKLTTPLGKDFLLPQRVFAQEQLGRGYEYMIDCLSIRDDLELKKLKYLEMENDSSV